MSVEGEKTDVFLLSFWETGKWQWGEAPAPILVLVSVFKWLCPASAGRSAGKVSRLSRKGAEQLHTDCLLITPGVMNLSGPWQQILEDCPVHPRGEGRAKSAAEGRVFPKSSGTGAHLQGQFSKA